MNTRAGTSTEIVISDVPFNVSDGSLVIIRNKDLNGSNWNVFDTERGSTNTIFTNTNDVETVRADSLKSFNGAGYTLGGSLSDINTNYDYLDIVLRKGASYGLDIVQYVGNETARNESHSLTKVPTMIWVKNRDNGNNWAVYHVFSNDNPETVYGTLDTTSAFVANSNWWNDTAPTSTQFSVGWGSETNEASDGFIAYVFTDIAGYCKAFTYTGNGNADGPYIPLDFRPAFWFVKRAANAGAWLVYDTARDIYNPANKFLQFESTNYERANGAVSDYYFDAVAKGLKVRDNSDALNASASTYVGFAWAYQPYKWSNAR